MSPPLFKDFGKPSKDLINKNYPLAKKVVLKTQAENGVALEAEVTKSDDLTGSFKPKFSVPKYGLEIEQSVNHKDLISGDLTVKDKLCKGSKVTLGHVCGGAAPKVSGAFEYKHEKGNVTVDAVYPLKTKEPTVAMSGVVGKSCIAAGVALKASVKSSELTNLDAGINYTKGKYSLAAVSNIRAPKNDNGILTSLLAHYAVDSNTNVAASVSFASASKTGSVLDQVNVTVGGSYKPDTQSTLRARWGSAGQIGLSWSNQINSRTQLTLATVVDTVNDTKSKLGFELSLDA